MSDKNRVQEYESIPQSIERIPFLGHFFYEVQSIYTLDSKKVNDYVGFGLVPAQSVISSGLINILLEIAEQRGDLD